MKIRHIALAAVTVACGQAYALTPTQVADSATVKIYMTGATAMRAMIGNLFTANCDPTVNNGAGDLDVYYSKASSVFGGLTFSKAGDAHRVYTCTMGGNSPLLPGRKVAFFKSDFGGSGQGVFPVHGKTPRGMLNVSLATCDTRTTSIPNYRCSGETSQIPMAGVSDLEPAMFREANVPKDDPTYPLGGLSDGELGELTINSLFQTVFAVAVNTALRNDMQAAQGLISGSEDEAQQPSISRATAASFFGGVLVSPVDGLGWQVVSNNPAKNDKRVNICRRVDGSGTQAAANAELLGYGCSSAPISPADRSYNEAAVDPIDPNTGDRFATSPLTGVGTDRDVAPVFVYEGSGTGDVINCLNAAQTASGYAIGHVSKENVPGSNNYRHIKLDGVTPGRINAKNGNYNYFFESTLQWNREYFDTLSSDQKSFLTAFATTAQLPESLAKTDAVAQDGYAALPNSYEVAYGAGTDAEKKFGSRVSRGGKSCNPVTIYK